MRPILTPWLRSAVFAASIMILFGFGLAAGQQLSLIDPVNPATISGPDSRAEDATPRAAQSEAIPGAVIRPFRQATLGSEVQGVVEKRNFKEGEFVPAGAVVFEISPDLFEILAERARHRLQGMEAAYEQAKEELELKRRLMDHDASTLQEIVRAEAEEKIAGFKVKEARKDLDLALRELRKCRVRAPMNGVIVAMHREAYESVNRFDQLFAIADTSKVYAVVNVPAALARQVKVGTPASFSSPSGASFQGVVDKVEAPIDPASQTKKVSVLINNSEGKLEMGALGTVAFLAPSSRRH